jgi:arylsulfatase A-like enzyme
MASLGLPTKEITLARVLRSSGYHTVHIGKWRIRRRAAISTDRTRF